MQISQLWTYPVKGLSPEKLKSVDLQTGGTFPFDRAYAIENGPAGFDPQNPQHISKMRFIVLARFASLAKLKTSFDMQTQILTIHKSGQTLAQGCLLEPEGRKEIEDFFDTEMHDELTGKAKVLNAANHSFSDLKEKRIHLINAQSLRELSKITGQQLDPLRFRANILVEGLEPWQEFEWQDKTIESSGGVRFSFHKATKRCAATTVNLESAQRDLPLPKILSENYGHMDFGIYLKVENNGTLADGDTLKVI
ncbi:MOSC domain-containing protein [Polycladidibacter stylochi]|uniref:MOSC domain-containing protein n=1 Tax=Polycladidibacter stylochi TaxID=1807766 RepID=UPI000835DF90|nr:MOSC domain-containing protein [Pseudovibrio stylochi]